MSEGQIETLSERELELLHLVSQGMSNQEIARQLYISPNTVKVHLRNVYAKLSVRSRTEAMRVALEKGWIKLEVSAERQADGLAQPTELTRPGSEAVLPAEAVAERRPVGERTLFVEPLALWKRIYMLVATILVVLGGWLTWPRPIESPQDLVIPTPTRAASFPSPSGWRSLADLPTPRSKLAVIWHKGQVWAIAGETASGISNVVEIYHPETNQWTSGTDKPVPVASVGAVALRGRVFVPGGMTANGQVTDVLEVYDPNGEPGGTWSTGQKMPRALCAYALAAYEGELYLFGGWDGQVYYSVSYRYDPRQDRWDELVPMPTQRAYAAAGTIGEYIYLVGGYDGKSELNTCEAYDPNADSWMACSPMQDARSGAGAAVIADKLYVVGGDWEEGGFLLQNEFFQPDSADPTRGSWQPFATPFLSRWFAPGVTSDETTLYAVGGRGSEVLNVNRAYNVLYRVFLPLGSSGR